MHAISLAAAIALYAARSFGVHPSTPGDAIAASERAGFDAVSLAAAQGSVASVFAIQTQLANMPEVVSAFWSCIEAGDFSIDAYEEVAFALWADPSIEELRPAVAVVESALSSAEANKAVIRELAMEGMGDPLASSMTNFVVNAHWRVPDEFKVLSGDKAFWAATEAALIAERRAARLGELLGHAEVALLATIRANPAVQAAKQGLEANLAAILAAVDQALATPPAGPE